MAPGTIKFATYERSTQLIKARFAKILSSVEAIEALPPPLSQVNSRSLASYANEIKKKRSDFEGNLNRVLESLSPEDAPVTLLSDDQDEINDTFIKIQSIIESLTPPEVPLTPSAHSEPGSTSSSIVSHVRLPKLELKHFDGNSLQWVSFINLFDSSVHRNASVTNVAKFQYLLSVLSGEPLNLIKSLSITTANYLVAYQLLRDRYHNPRRLTTLHLNQIIDLPEINSASIRGLRTFVNVFYEHSEALKALNCDVSTQSNPLLSALILRKMDSDLRKKLESFRSSQENVVTHSLPEVSEIIQFLNTECNQAEDAGLHITQKTNANRSPHNKNSKTVSFSERSKQVALLSVNKTTPACFACSEHDHRIYSCTTFRNLSPQERYQLAKKENRCVSCLGSHDVKQCKSQMTCNTCHKRHHSLLHFSQHSSQNDYNKSRNDKTTYTEKHNYKRPTEGHIPKAKSSEPQMMSAHSSTLPEADTLTCLNGLRSKHSEYSHTTVLLGTTLVKLTTPNGHSHVLRALLDSGSMCDFITERAANLLGTRRFASNLKIAGLSQLSTSTKGMLPLNVETLSGQLMASKHTFHILDKISVDLPRTTLSPEVMQRVQPYILADPTFHLPGGIDVLLGGSLLPKLLTQENYSLGPHMPHVIGTHFGFVLMGQAPCAQPSHAVSNFAVSLLSTNDNTLHSALQRFWQQEEPPHHNRKTAEEDLCDTHFKNTHSRTPNGRYVVRLPFRNEHVQLGTSQSIAERRFLSLEQKFKSQPEFYTLYKDFMSDYESQGHLVKAEDLNLNSTHYFLPHHGVLKDGISTTKLRTVFDASSKTSNGVSLNDVLLTGRKLQTDICDIILNFRSHPIVFSCDIKQMYRQIQVHPDDQRFQLILWRNNPSQDISVYKLTTVTYGMNSSPYLAIKTLSQLAEDEGDSFPQASHALRHHTYVDDIVTGAETIESALQLQDELIQLLARGGFELRKWASNASQLLQNLPTDHLEPPGFLKDSQQPQLSILGLHWSPDEDAFCYNFKYSQDVVTKRTILSLIAKLYDPCGFLAPLIMLAKCFMQLLWSKGFDWDEPLPLELKHKWQNLISDIHKNLSSIRIPRTFQLNMSTRIELHGFSDASEAGYAAVVYFRCEHNNGNITTRQIISKTRVAPLKKVTLPRLELCAAHLLAQLVTYCINQFKHLTIHHSYLWCDSSVVLTWIQTPPYRLKTYVANRVAQIQELIPSEKWRHIKGTENPADCASRGILASQLVNHPLWWHGPEWLNLSNTQWPNPRFTPVNLELSQEVKNTPLTVLTSTTPEEWNLLKRFSSWTKLNIVMAYIQRFIHNCRSKDKHSGAISAQELKNAKLKIFKLVQINTFSDDIKLLNQGKICSSKLKKLTPFLDPNGLIRVGGRLSHSYLPQDACHPVILPKKDPVVDLFIDYIHKIHLHSGPQLTQALLARQVWILSARSIIRTRIFKCITCFKNKPRNKTPLMGDLPISRVTPSRPFLSTGIDYAGPFNVRVHNLRALRQIKVYLCIFICMTTKAVHFEVVTDLTTDGFIAALTRFVSRRGLCSDIFSDCGTNFVGANTILRKLTHDSIRSYEAQEKIAHYTSPRGINFHFNPPAAPHQGGLWESAVRSAKHHLRRVMGDSVLTLSQFITLTTQVEAMLNSRPLTALSTDPAELSALTPGHFLIGAPLAALPEPNLREVPSNRLHHWQLIQAFHQRIWQRWQLEYLHTLQQRSKWTTPQDNLKVNDLVLVHNSTPPLTWPLARITAVHPGSDGMVRVVQLKTSQGTLTRPATKVFPLPIN